MEPTIGTRWDCGGFVRYPLILVFLLGLVGCGGDSAPTTPTPTPTTTSTSAAIVMTDAVVSGWTTGTGSSYRIAFRMHETAGVTATLTAVTITLSAGGTPFYSVPYADGSHVTDAWAMPNYTIADNDPQHPFATRLDVAFTYSDANGHTGLKAAVGGDVGLIGKPVVNFTTDRTTLNPGESTTLRWSVSGASSGLYIEGYSDASFRASGTLLVTPCPGYTAFTLHASNLAGAVSATVWITESVPVGVVSLCGNWSGIYSETWTDSLGGSGTYSNSFGLSLRQWDANVRGTWFRGIDYRGTYHADLSATLTGSDITGTLVYRDGLGDPQTVCPSTFAATVSADATRMSGIYSSKCQLADGRERTTQGSFTGTRLASLPYPQQGSSAVVNGLRR